ncbi:hypothetical protein [Streptomyces yaizuensis]|uniref:Uncharacterized protein n=1 Tax=Streptomyces yaizuensis TaxID=2989713 RepID=A0ABQ5PB77_9ACTN|nr:hypothetical protein [Streptomyces sp. YSPA8]GLF99854.1 hypothetical protein SYYSPA8_36175 [Streptomyces sp. YSPA8]
MNQTSVWRFAIPVVTTAGQLDESAAGLRRGADALEEWCSLFPVLRVRARPS